MSRPAAFADGLENHEDVRQRLRRRDIYLMADMLALLDRKLAEDETVGYPPSRVGGRLKRYLKDEKAWYENEDESVTVERGADPFAMVRQLEREHSEQAQSMVYFQKELIRTEELLSKERSVGWWRRLRVKTGFPPELLFILLMFTVMMGGAVAIDLLRAATCSP